MATQKKKSANYLTQAALLVEEWQETLRIVDWMIEIVPAAHDSGVFARVRICSGSMRATMEVRDPVYASDSNSYTNDLEVTIIHELLHLRFFETEAAMGHEKLDGHETAIELTAMALVASKRGVPVRSLY